MSGPLDAVGVGQLCFISIFRRLMPKCADDGLEVMYVWDPFHSSHGNKAILHCRMKERRGLCETSNRACQSRQMSSSIYKRKLP